MVVHTFDPRTQRQRQMDLCEFKASQVYSRVRCKTANDTQRNPFSKQSKIKNIIKRNRIFKKPHKDVKYTENWVTFCYYLVFELLDC